MTATRQLCTFTLDDRLFGIEVRHVQEVLRLREMTRVTLAPRVIRGLINLRGEIVMAVDLRRCLGLDEAAGDAPPMNLVIRARDEPISFLVDRILDVVDVDDATFEPPPPNLHGPIRHLIRGTYPSQDRLILALDVEALLDLIESLAATAAATDAVSAE